ncbi:MAG: PilZ domain-containing protein, partial [Thermodesulfovibrionales bacterium]
AASSIFIGKSLAIIDESAENKESLLAAADRVSKRIALFIDTDMAVKVFEVLRVEIENRELTSGTRRKHVRVAMCNKVYVTCNGAASELYTVNVSAGGMYIKTKEPFPVGSKVVIAFPLEKGSLIHLNGVVANIQSGIGKQPPGMGIEFKEVRDDELKRLRDFVKKASAQDILENKEATKPSLVGN